MYTARGLHLQREGPKSGQVVCPWPGPTGPSYLHGLFTSDTKPSKQTPIYHQLISRDQSQSYPTSPSSAPYLQHCLGIPRVYLEPKNKTLQLGFPHHTDRSLFICKNLTPGIFPVPQTAAVLLLFLRQILVVSDGK